MVTWETRARTEGNTFLDKGEQGRKSLRVRLSLLLNISKASYLWFKSCFVHPFSYVIA